MSDRQVAAVLREWDQLAERLRCLVGEFPHGDPRADVALAALFAVQASTARARRLLGVDPEPPRREPGLGTRRRLQVIANRGPR